tara:strand:+ start:1131 stop:1724 length:594 start_codon:yes stop_codon:yes gene_type:complete
VVEIKEEKKKKEKERNLERNPIVNREPMIVIVRVDWWGRVQGPIGSITPTSGFCAVKLPCVKKLMKVVDSLNLGRVCADVKDSQGKLPKEAALVVVSGNLCQSFLLNVGTTPYARGIAGPSAPVVCKHKFAERFDKHNNNLQGLKAQSFDVPRLRTKEGNIPIVRGTTASALCTRYIKRNSLAHPVCQGVSGVPGEQ